MHRLVLVILITLLAPPALADAGSIQAVTVFADRAKVTRVMTEDVPRGGSVVQFTGLPEGLMPDSLRVEGESPRAVVTLGALTHEVVTTRDLTSAKEQALTDAIEALEDQVRGVAAEKAALAARQAFIQSLGKQAALRSDEEIAELRLAPDQWAGAAAAIQQDTEEALKATLAAEIRVRSLERDIAQKRAELAQLRTGQRRTYTVAVPVEADGPTPLTLRLSYQVAGASWRPLYDARLSTHDGALAVTQYGEVRQRTGEDWDGVALTLSTAQPQRGAALPSLTPWWVDLFRAVPMTRRAYEMDGFGSNVVASSPSMAMEDKMRLEKADAPEEIYAAPEPAHFAQAAIEGGEFVAAAYAIPGPASVPSGGKAVKVMVGDSAFDSALEVHVKPQLSAEAFLAARATLKGDAPLLPGAVKLFRDGAYVGEGHLALLKPGDEEVLFFGVDDKVAVERETLADLRKDAGIILRENTLERRYVTEVTNLHAEPVTLVVKETVPAPRNEKIRLEVLAEGTRAGYAQDYADITGLLAWRLEAAPGARERVGLAWRLAWPKGEEVSGL
ncbi:MAG TPA: hypothetical protein DDX54_05610 [Rhodospirillaceae bacterium]|jgi:uncharacterized protein (TIGR02231 family)|nr:mucoidy inhibitor MuiA family protein [Alphaproteobacteria bacterium]HBH26859.1 hypothetical protein [Rhodospirillaceae bacterium]